MNTAALSCARKQLEVLRNLSAGWDSRGGQAPDPEIVREADALLDEMASSSDIPPPHIHPTPGGGVQFEWESGSRYFEIEWIDPITIQYYYEDKDAGDEYQGTFKDGGVLDGVREYASRVGVTS